jgi:hypothetical protein
VRGGEILGVAATKSPAKTVPRLTACSGWQAEKQLVDMYVSYFSDSIGSFSTVRSGISHTLVCSADRWDKSLVFKTDASRAVRRNGTRSARS